MASAERCEEEPVTQRESFREAKCCYNRAGLLTALIQIPVNTGSGSFPEHQRTMSHSQVFGFEKALVFYFNFKKKPAQPPPPALPPRSLGAEATPPLRREGLIPLLYFSLDLFFPCLPRAGRTNPAASLTVPVPFPSPLRVGTRSTAGGKMRWWLLLSLPSAS